MGCAKPDILVDADKAEGVETEGEAEWIVRLEKRDDDCRFYFFDRNWNVNARLSSAMRFYKDDARKLAHAISYQHPVYRARAMLYSTMRKRKDSSDK